MNKYTDLEMKIYEIFGIKYFKKLILRFEKILMFPILIALPKEKRKRFLHNTHTNYHIGKIESLEDVESFKKMLYMNAIIHIFCLIPLFWDGGIIQPASLLNIYCIMLQRYNFIRINKTIEKMRPKYEKKMNEIREELKETDVMLPEHSYSIIDSKNNEVDITFDDLINNASYKELKHYQKCLLACKVSMITDKELKIINNKNKIKYYMPGYTTKKLQLEFKNNI